MSHHPYIKNVSFTPAAHKPKIGDLRVGLRSDYEEGEGGFVIEEYWNSELGWVIGNYEENGQGFNGVYDTREAAEADLHNYR
jgi:hypothetical protein